SPPGTAYRSPSLVLLKVWLSRPCLWPGAWELGLLAFGLAMKIRQHKDGEAILTNASHLLSDTRLDQEVPRQLRRDVGVKGSERLSAEAEDPPAGAALPEIQQGASIIIFCDVLYSGETADRFAKQVVRDDATPLAVICFVDARENKTTSQPVY